MLRHLCQFSLALLWAASLSGQTAPSSFIEARRGFTTKLTQEVKVGEPAEKPPKGVLDLVSYPGPLGKNAAYVSPRPSDGKKHPAIIWLVGGFSNSISPVAWTPGEKSNDQSAAGFRTAGVLMMYPSLRGGNENPGRLETLYGEVDDVIAAATYLASLDHVDASRIYLGGHSTGGTLALLVAAASGDRFRAVLALGPVEDVAGYGTDVILFDPTDANERRLRAPQNWLADIRCPTFVFEGTKGNIESLRALLKRSRNPLLHFRSKPGQTHFSIIAPLVEQMARSILADDPAKPAFTLLESEK